MPTSVECLIEAGARRTFASAAPWPGWCRAGRDEPDAIASLYVYGSRYADALGGSGVRFAASTMTGALTVIERVPGNATTDFGAPDGAFEADRRPIAGREWTRLRTVLEACWRAFDRSVVGAEGVELRKGPRGGGRELEAIVTHVVGAEASYLRKLTGSGIGVEERDAWAAREAERAAVRDGLGRAQEGKLPERGPRGGVMWAPRRFLRRAAWHVLDHAWEIQDRAAP